MLQLPCPTCGSNARQRYRWKPDASPTKERHECFDCGYDSGWRPYEAPGTLHVACDGCGDPVQGPAIRCLPCRMDRLDRLAAVFGR